MSSQDTKQSSLGDQLINFLSNYYLKIQQFPVQPHIKPGFLHNKPQAVFPQDPVSPSDIIKNFETNLLPGVVHWSSPHFLSFFPSNCIPATIYGYLLQQSLGDYGSSQSQLSNKIQKSVTSQAGRFLQLHPSFIQNDWALPKSQKEQKSDTYSAIYNTAGDAFRCVAAAAKKKLIANRQLNFDEYHEKMVAYMSTQSNFAIERALSCLNIKVRRIKTVCQKTQDQCCSGNYITDIQDFKKVLKSDKQNGFLPCIYIATVGTTSTLACQSVGQIHQICIKDGIWVHIDSAMAGVGAVCEEYHKNLFKDFASAQSISINFSKWGGCNISSSFLWCSQRKAMFEALKINDDYEDNNNYHLGSPKPERGIKSWTVLNWYGKDGYQKLVRETSKLAQYFGKKVKESKIFELIVPPVLSLVCFRLVKDKAKKQEFSTQELNSLNEKLSKKVNEPNKLFLVTSKFEGMIFLRLAFGTNSQTYQSTDKAWSIIYNDAIQLIG